MTERAKPFMAYQIAGYVGAVHAFYRVEQKGFTNVPVAVVPLLPDDPKVGETWVLGDDGSRVSIIGPVVVDCEGRAWVETSMAILEVKHLRRPPVLKTFRLPGLVASPARYVEFQAESREAALASLAEGLEEVTDR